MQYPPQSSVVLHRMRLEDRAGPNRKLTAWTLAVLLCVLHGDFGVLSAMLQSSSSFRYVDDAFLTTLVVSNLTFAQCLGHASGHASGQTCRTVQFQKQVHLLVLLTVCAGHGAATCR